KPPADIIRDRGLGQVSDEGAVEAVVDQVLAAAATEVESYRAGKTQVFGFLVGQCMKAMKGKGNPQLVNAVLKRKLGG
ncbi:MAG: aspartyl/glutamyl-tRNA amidotransferase subunit, partial [Pseudomonadota bacterium]